MMQRQIFSSMALHDSNAQHLKKKASPAEGS